MLLKQVVEVVGLGIVVHNSRTRVCSYCGYCGFREFCKTAKTAETASGLFDIHHLSSALPEDKPMIALRFPCRERMLWSYVLARQAQCWRAPDVVCVVVI